MEDGKWIHPTKGWLDINHPGSVVETTRIGFFQKNHGFRRLMLRSLPKVEIEVGLHALAHNFRKLAAQLLPKPTHKALLTLGSAIT